MNRRLSTLSTFGVCEDVDKITDRGRRGAPLLSTLSTLFSNGGVIHAGGCAPARPPASTSPPSEIRVDSVDKRGTSYSRLAVSLSTRDVGGCGQGGVEGE